MASSDKKMTKDALAFLASIRIKTDKTPAEMKHEAQQAMMDASCARLERLQQPAKKRS